MRLFRNTDYTQASMTPNRRVILSAATAMIAIISAPGAAQTGATSAPLSDIRYEVTFTRANAARRQVTSTMTFTVGGTDPVLLSLPRWTPGAYELAEFARDVGNFAAQQAGTSLRWDKTGPDTWRVRPRGVGEVSVRFDYLADSLDNANTWARPDFLLFNGTNLFLYPEGRGLDFPASVTINTEPGWKIVTGMT
jgi:predicted metalloprotease with PDZ domain